MGTKGEIEEESPEIKKDSAVLIQHKGKYLFDFGKTHKGKCKEVNPDYLFITHTHPDHIGGLPETINIPTILSNDSYNQMKKFYYFGKPITESKGKIGEIKYEMIQVYHSILAPTVGFIINIENKKIGYFPDFLDFKNKKDKDKLQDLDILIAGASSINRNIVRKGNIGHISMKGWLNLAKELNIKKIIFTHYGKEVVEKGLNKTYEDLKDEYQDINFKLAFDNYKTKMEMESINISEGIGDKTEKSEQQKEIMYIPNFISIVGSRAIGNYNENSDWDILIRKEKRDESLELLIRRYFGKDKNLHFIYTPYGPHGDYIPLYNLKLAEIPDRKVIFIESVDFEPVKNYTPPKMGASYSFEEFYDIEELINKWANAYFERGIKVFVEKKLNGWRGIIQKKGKEIGIFFEGTKDNRKNQFKKLTDLLSELNDDFILDSEFSAKEVNTGKIISRKDLAGWGHNPDKEIDIDSFETPEGVKAKLNIVLFDIPYLNEDISKQMLKERRKILEDFYKKLPKEYFELINYYVVSNPKELKDAVEKVSNLEASEGAVLKSENSIYLKEEIPDWAKFKKIVEIKVQVLEKMKTKDGNAFNYVVGYLKNGKIVELCKTMNTKVDAKIGDILTLSCEEIILNIEDGEFEISIQIPRVRDIDLNRKEPDDLNTIIEKGYKGKILQATSYMINELKKRKIVEAKDEGDTGGDWKKDFLDYFEKGTKGKFVLQEHERGLTEEQAKSGKRFAGKENIHCDLRFYIKKPTELSFLIGVTLATPSRSDLPNKIIEPKKGKVLIVGFKKKQPLSWLDVGKGEIDLGGGHTKINIYGKEFKADLNEPGGVGSTSNTWSRFIAIDEGQFEVLEKGNHHLLIEFKSKNKFLDGTWSISGAPLNIEPKFGNRVWFFQKSAIMNKGEEK